MNPKNSPADTRPAFPPEHTYLPLIMLARAEDLGSPADDCTSRIAFDGDVAATGLVVQKAAGRTCGVPLIQTICRVYDASLHVDLPVTGSVGGEGCFNDAGTTLATIRGRLRSLLAAERVILNFLQHLSGVATLTHTFVKRIEGTGAGLVDTRKTLPGFRALDKYAVLCGGGQNHRVGLYDMMLVKDNHLAGFVPSMMPDQIRRMVAASRAEAPHRPIEVEVDSLEQLAAVLPIDGIDYVLLDNMDPQRLRTAVSMRNAAGRQGALLLEASGGVTLETIRDIAETGVDRISVGFVTHSAPALDIGLDIAL